MAFVLLHATSTRNRETHSPPPLEPQVRDHRAFIFLVYTLSLKEKKERARCNLVNGRSKRSRKKCYFPHPFFYSLLCLSGSYFSRGRRFKKKEKNTRRRVKLARQTDETGSSLILPESSRLRHWFGEREEDDYKTFTRRHFTLQLIRNAKRYFSLMDTLHIWLSLLSLSLSNTKSSWSRITKDDISKPTPQHRFPTLFGP